MDLVLNEMDYQQVKRYFLTLPPTNELPIGKFHEDLYSMKCIVFNYYDYLVNKPMDVTEEVKRIETTDLTTTFAILTLVFREDHFCNGAIERRIEDGTLDRVIERIKYLIAKE